MEETATFGRGAEPAPATTVMRHMVYGSGLTHALDYVVLLHLLFMLEEDRPVTVKDLWEALQVEGIRSAKNAKELVGRDAVYQSVTRLIEARFVHRVEEGSAPGRFGSVRYLVYRQPAYHPEFTQPSDPWTPQDHPDFPHAKPQVTPLPGTPEAGTPEPPRQGKTAGRTASRNAVSGNAGHGVPGSGNPRIPAGRTASGVPGSGTVSPPHPPSGGGGTSSPLPPVDGAGSTGGPAAPGEEEAVCFAPEDLAEAKRFLMLLPAPWACGRKDAERIAPRLLEEVAAQGWQLDDDLARQLTLNPGGVKNYPVTLERKRVPNLPLREAVQRRLPAPAAPDQTGKCVKPGHGGGTFTLDECPECRLQRRADQTRQGRPDPATEFRRLGRDGFLASLRADVDRVTSRGGDA
ncbi:hypothetical protein RVR_P154 (plasmid) [Actinacidiphila reveromycinica]|uniref:Uncharacterized protein n=2 Tax=Actinacidiphila reveromycinica TaxID=659352 RepID=A0A7R6QEY9_9ACTN|nr:hypothetical protein RVR_P154 [Streptomyces sp. SN-593]